MPEPEPSSLHRQDPYALRPLSRRTLLTGLAGVGGLTVASRVLGAGPTYASTTGYVSPTSLPTDVSPAPLALSLPVQADGRVLHGVWLPNGPASSTASTVLNYDTYFGTGIGGSGHGPAIINYFRAWSLDIGLYNTAPTTNIFESGARQ